MNWKEILISSAEVAVLASITEITALNQISWATLVPVGLTFIIKLAQEIKARSSSKSTAGKKRVPKYKTLFFKN